MEEELVYMFKTKKSLYRDDVHDYLHGTWTTTLAPTARTAGELDAYYPCVALD